MKLLLFVIFNVYIPSNSEWICDKDTGKCRCDDGICNMNGQTYYSDYVCTPNAESCTINCIENYSCFQANFYMNGRNVQIKCNSHHSCLNSKIHCDGDIDSCRIQIHKNAMIDGYIQCNNNVSNCFVDIISKPKEIAIQRTIFACTNRFECQLNGCNNNQCIELQMNCMNQSNCICNGNDCNENIERNVIKSKRIVNKRYLLDNSTKTTEIVISGENLAVTQFTAIEYIVITISLLFCLGTFGIFLIICYCQRLKSQALQQFRTTQKQSSMHHQNEHSINQLKYAISDDDHQTMTRLSIKNQSNTSNKSNMTNTSNISNVSVPSTTGIGDNQRQKKEHNYPHHTMKRSRSRETGYSLKPQALKMKKTLSAGNIPPPNPVQLRSSESYVSSESHLPQLISLTDHVSNSYNSHFIQQQQVQHSQSKTQPFNMVGSYNNTHFNYPKPALALESESFPRFNDATDNNHNNHNKHNNHNNLQRAKTISIDQNGVQHHHHIYYINTMQPQLSSPHSQPRTPSQAPPIQAPSISYGPLNNSQASSSLPFHSNPPQISPQISYNTNWNSNVLPNFQSQQHQQQQHQQQQHQQQQKLSQKMSMTPPIPANNPDEQRLNVHGRIEPLHIAMAYHSKPLTSGSPYSDLTSVTSTHITGNIQNSMSPETNISDESINHCCDDSSDDSSDDSLPTRSSSCSCSTPSKTSRQGQFSFDDDSDRSKINQKIMVKKSINKNCVYANISVLSPKSGNSDTNATSNRELSGAVASVLGEIIGIKKHKSLEISEDTNNNLNTNEASNNISNDAQYNYASSQFSLSETPQPESYVSSLQRHSYSTNHTNIYDSSNRYSNVITNIKKQKKPYKY